MQYNRDKNRTRRACFLVAVALVCLASGPIHSVAWGQAPEVGDVVAAGPAPAADEEAVDDSLLTLIVGTGPTGWLFMGILLIFSFYSVTIAIERAAATRKVRILPNGFLGEIRSLATSATSTAEDFRRLCGAWDVPVARVIDAGLERCGMPLPEIEKSLEDKAAREIATLKGRIRPLQTVGRVAPLIGLLGTVVGMIVAFRTASQGLGRGERMAEGIYLALMTTAAGLSIAIPALLLSAFFTSRVERYFREMAEELGPTILRLARLPAGVRDGQPVDGNAATATVAAETADPVSV